MAKKLPSKTFCVLPWMHLAVNPGGSFRVCCNSNPKNNKIIKDPNTQKEYKIFRDSVEDMWNSPTYKEFRRQFLNGERPETCQRCFREEDAGVRPPRPSRPCTSVPSVPSFPSVLSVHVRSVRPRPSTSKKSLLPFRSASFAKMWLSA